MWDSTEISALELRILMRSVHIGQDTEIKVYVTEAFYYDGCLQDFVKRSQVGTVITTIFPQFLETVKFRPVI